MLMLSDSSGFLPTAPNSINASLRSIFMDILSPGKEDILGLYGCQTRNSSTVVVMLAETVSKVIPSFNTYSVVKS